MSQRLKVIQTTHDWLDAEESSGPARWHVPMAAITFHGKRATYHPDGLNAPIWMDDDGNFHDTPPAERSPDWWAKKEAADAEIADAAKKAQASQAQADFDAAVAAGVKAKLSELQSTQKKQEP